VFDQFDIFEFSAGALANFKRAFCVMRASLSFCSCEGLRGLRALTGFVGLQRPAQYGQRCSVPTRNLRESSGRVQ
jgi:hypothetical protein